MRFIGHTLFILLIVSNAGTNALSLKLTALDPEVKSGSKIVIEVSTTNQSKQTITYHNTSRFCDYSVTVQTSIGVPAEETSFKKQMDCSSGGGLKITGRDIVVTLNPRESDRERIELTELYNMSSIGKYSVHVDRTFPSIGHFSSNLVSVTVTP